MDFYIGTIFLWPIGYAPEGFLFCEGQQLPVNQYQALYALIGNRFGGQSPTNFNLPDFRGRVPMGKGFSSEIGVNINLAQVVGSARTPSSLQNLPSSFVLNSSQLQASGSITVTASQLPAHSHTVNQQIVSVKIPASSGTVATTLTNDPTNNSLAQGTATAIANNQAKIYTTGTTNVSLAAFDLTIPQSTTASAGSGQSVSVNLPVTGSASGTGVVAIPTGAFSILQPSLGIGFIIAVTGIYPVNPN